VVVDGALVECVERRGRGGAPACADVGGERLERLGPSTGEVDGRSFARECSATTPPMAPPAP
jgi:hypothetical protein